MLKEVQSICSIVEDNKSVFKSIANRNIETTLSVNSMFSLVKIYLKSYYDFRDDEEKIYVCVNISSETLLELKIGDKKSDIAYSKVYNLSLVQALFNDVLKYLKSLVKSGE